MIFPYLYMCACLSIYLLGLGFDLLVPLLLFLFSAKNFEKGFSFDETHARSHRGGRTMGRTAEGRSELAELAESLPPLQMHPSRSPHEEQGQ